MNPEVKTKWVAALRSGDYRQGRGTLRSSADEYCCLGVLCDLAVKDGILDQPDRGPYRGSPWSYGGNSGYPPVGVDYWVGALRMGTLVDMNDTGVPFSEIADYIEANL